MGTIIHSFRGLSALLSALVLFAAAPAEAQTCANDRSRTIFAGGPGTEACDQFDGDQENCERAFHRSGAGHLAPCVWDGNCFGNTAHFVTDTPNSCEVLPEPQTCADPTRTLMLTGGANGSNSGSNVCQSVSDEETCETAWHTTPKGVGIACCWREEEDDCVGSAWGFANGGCTHGNTCFVSTARTSAPTFGTFGLLLLVAVMVALGASQLQRTSRPI